MDAKTGGGDGEEYWGVVGGGGDCGLGEDLECAGVVGGL